MTEEQHSRISHAQAWLIGAMTGLLLLLPATAQPDDEQERLEEATPPGRRELARQLGWCGKHRAIARYTRRHPK